VTRAPAWRVPALLLALYLGLALALLGGALLGGRGSFPGAGTDPAIFMWDLEWVPFALGHHLDPLVTSYIQYPAGANLMWNTSILFPALLMAPVTALPGPVTSYGILTILAVGLSAWCGALAIRRHTARWLPAAIGGLLYGFSPYMMSQALRHPQLDIAVYPPLVLLLADEILVRRRRSPLLLGTLLGAATAAQLLTGEEVLGLTALMAVIVLVALALTRRHEVATALQRALPAAAAAFASFAVLAGCPIYVQLLGPQRISGLSRVLDIYAASPGQLIDPSAMQEIAPFGHSGFIDTSVYVGVPLILLALTAVVVLRRRTVIQLAAVALGAAIVLCLGTALRVGGLHIPLPWTLITHLPMLSDAVPLRIMLFGYLALSLLVAVSLDAALGHADVRLRRAGAVAVVVALLPLFPSLPYPTGRFAIPAFFTDGSTAQIGGPGSVLMTPYLGVEPLVWQAASGMAFRTEQGLVFVPGSGLPHWSAPDDALGTELTALGTGAQSAPATLSPSMRETYLADLRAHGVTSIVVGPSAGEAGVVRFVTELTGRSGQSSGGVVVWSQLP
jgi:hypothetical protein